MLEKNTRKSPAFDLRLRIRNYYRTSSIGNVSTAWNDYGQGTRDLSSPITLSPGLTDHLDKHRPGLLRCSDLAKEVDANPFHSLIRLQSKSEAQSVY
jgi:hypothetical protein